MAKRGVYIITDVDGAEVFGSAKTAYDYALRIIKQRGHDVKDYVYYVSRDKTPPISLESLKKESKGKSYGIYQIHTKEDWSNDITIHKAPLR